MSDGLLINQWDATWVYFSGSHCPETDINTHVSAYCHWSLWGFLYAHEHWDPRVLRWNYNNFSPKMPGYSRLYMDRKYLCKFNHIRTKNLQGKRYIIISIQERYAPMKRPRCPHNMQQNRWKIVWTSYTVFTLLRPTLTGNVMLHIDKALHTGMSVLVNVMGMEWSPPTWTPLLQPYQFHTPEFHTRSR